MKLSSIFAALGAACLFAAAAPAQDPYGGDVSPAYRHFLTSPYSYRTYSYLGSGRAWGYDTPLESGRFYQTPDYYHEEIAPSGRWSYQAPVIVNGYVVRRPLIVYPPVWAAPYPYPPPP